MLKKILVFKIVDQPYNSDFFNWFSYEGITHLKTA